MAYDPDARDKLGNPLPERRENVRHMLSHYRPYDFPTWAEVSGNNIWDHPSMRALVEDIRRNGVQRPVPVDYEQDPPQVRNGHTRLLAAERAGVADVPVRQYVHYADPDDESPSWHDEWKQRQAALLDHFEASAPDDYRGQHQGPGADDGEAMHEIGSGKVYPADIHEHPDWYISADGPGSWDSYDKARRSTGWPSRRVTMYRSLPSPHRSVNTGDWVTSSAEYAREHGRQSNPDDDWPVVRFEARADQLRTAGDSINEWSYHGPPIRRALVHFSGGKNHRGKGPRGGKADAALHEHEPPEMYADYTEQNRQRRERLRAEREQKEASVQHQGASGETAPEGHQIWAVPQEGRSPVGDEVFHNMGHREPGDEHGSAWYQGISYHGPYHVIRHPQTRQVWLVDRHGRDASPTGGHYGNPERDGSWGEHQAWEQQHGLESAGPEAHRFGTADEPRLNLMNERVPEFPHSRVDPEDIERVNRPAARVHAPDGVSPSDEYHGSYEVVRHPETDRFHVVDNAGRSAHVLPLDGFKTQLQAERSRDYTEKSQRSKEIGRGIAEGIWEGAHEAIDPGGTAESRQSEENMRTASEMMDRYHGGLGEIKFDPDEEGGSPYYEREHLLGSGKPSGWYAKHYGGAHTDVYHRATGGESHQTLHLPQHPEDENISMTPRLHPDFGDEHLAGALKEWHDDEETGERQYIEANNPLIARWKRRHLGSVPEVVAHFEDPGPRPFTAAAGPAGGEEYGPKPEFRAAPEHLSEDEKMAHWEGERQKRHAWESHVRRGLGLGHLDYGRARELGYWGDGSEYPEELYDHEGNRVVHRGWQPLPEHMYHVTTDMPSVREHGLKTRNELSQVRGKGLGAGPDDTVSLTSDRATAENILRAVHEHHDVVTGKKTPAQMIEEARAGHGAKKPFLHDLVAYSGETWDEGEPMPRGLDAKVRGVELKRGGYLHTPEEMAEREGPGWRPHPESDVLPGRNGETLYNSWERDSSPERKREQASGLYRDFAVARAHAGGPEDPLFTGTDVHGFAAMDPSRFGIVHVRPRPGAQGFPLSALHEWRTTTGDALEVHRAQRLEHGHLKEAAVSRFAALENPHTHGHEWYHGSPHAFGEFYEGNGSPLEFEDDPHDTSHWNTLLGNHFAASHSLAEEFSRGEHGGDGDRDGDDFEWKPAENVLHARLELKNPKVYASEHDMDQEAYEHEWKAGNHHDAHHDPAELAEAKEYGAEDELPPTYQYAGHGDRMRSRDEADPVYWNLHRTYHPYATGWLNTHPDKYDIAQRFRQRLTDAGHDGIVYGNEFEHHVGDGKADGNHVCAVPFRAGQIDVTQRHSGPGCIDAEAAKRQWPGRDQPMLPGMGEHDAALEVVAHFEEPRTAAPVHMQQKLFHMQPDPTLNTPGSGRHNPADPLAGVRRRQEEDPHYMPPQETWDDPVKGNQEDDGHYRHPGHGGYYCHACSDYQDEPTFHDSAETSESHETAATDWDEEYPNIPAMVHRGLRVEGGAHLADHPDPEHVARAILRHVGDDHMHWTGDEEQARHYAVVGSGGHGGAADLNVVLHARKPDRDDIETDPEILGDRNVYGIGHHDDEEIPLRSGAPVHVTGVTWRAHGRGPMRYPDTEEWQRHDFDQPAEHTAALTEGPAPLSSSEERGDRWHEFQGRHMPDALHRGIHVRLPDDLHWTVHDPTEPMEERARALAEHLSGTGLGMHWTPHLHIAQRAIANAADQAPESYGSYAQEHGHAGYPDDEYDIDRYNQGDDEAFEDEAPRRNTDVIFHVHRPGERNRLRNPEQLAGYGVGDSPDEEEMPLKPGTPLRLTGISWREHDPRYPLAAYEHHDFASPVRHVSSRALPVVAHFEEDPHVTAPQTAEDAWSHLQEMHGARPSPASDKTPNPGFVSALHRRLHNGKSPFPGAVPHEHEAPGDRSASERPRADLSRMFTPVPPEELEAQRQARVPRPERLDDREYSIGDVSRHYDWEGFDPYEISHLVRDPEHAVFTREDVPVHTLRLAGENGLEPPHSYEDIAAQGDDERERLHELERGYDQDAPIPPIVTVRDGEHHVIADGSHRAAVYARQGRTRIPAFVTQRTIYPGQHTAVSGGHEPVTAESLEVVAHFSEDFPFEDPEHEPRTPFNEAWEAVERDSLYPKEQREAPSISIGRRPVEDLPPGGEDFQWGGNSPHRDYFRSGGPEGWRRADLNRHLREDHPSAGLEDALLRADAQGRGSADHYQALDAVHRRAHGRELGPIHSDDPGGVFYEELEHGHRRFAEEAEEEERQRQQEDDEDRRRQHVTLHGETANLHEVERHLRDVHGIPQHAMPEFHHTADDGPYTTPYSSELEELHDQDHAESGSYRHEEPDEESPRIHGEEMGHEDAYLHLSEHHGHNHDDLRSEEPSASRLEQYHEEAHDRERGTQWNTHHRDDPWDFSEGKARRVHPLERDPDDEDEEDGIRSTAAASRTGAYDWDADEGPYEWSEIGDRYPHVYGEDSGDSEGIGDAAAHLYHDRPGHPYSETYGELNPSFTDSGGMVFHPRTVEPSRIDYARSESGDPRVNRARKGYEGQQPEKVPPLILVHRHGVFQVADGHHRAEGAAKANRPVRAYVAYSPHEDEPFSGGDRAPYHGASTEEPKAWPDQNGVVRRISYPGFPHTAEVPRPQAHEASRREEVALVPVYDTAPALGTAPSLPCARVDAVVDAIALLGAWQPQDARDAALGVIALKAVFEALQAALGRVSRAVEEMPVHPDVAEGLYRMSLAARTASEDCERTAPRLPTEASWEEPPAPPNR